MSEPAFWKVTMRKNSPVTSGIDQAVEQEDDLERLADLGHAGTGVGQRLAGGGVGVGAPWC